MRRPGGSGGGGLCSRAVYLCRQTCPLQMACGVALRAGCVLHHFRSSVSVVFSILVAMSPCRRHVVISPLSCPNPRLFPAPCRHVALSPPCRHSCRLVAAMSPFHIPHSKRLDLKLWCFVYREFVVSERAVLEPPPLILSSPPPLLPSSTPPLLHSSSLPSTPPHFIQFPSHFHLVI